MLTKQYFFLNIDCQQILIQSQMLRVQLYDSFSFELSCQNVEWHKYGNDAIENDLDCIYFNRIRMHVISTTNFKLQIIFKWEFDTIIARILYT